MKENNYEVTRKLEELITTNLGSDRKTLKLKGYLLIYIVSNLEQAINLKHKYDLEDVKNKDMLELYDTCINDVIDTLLDGDINND